MEIRMDMLRHESVGRHDWQGEPSVSLTADGTLANDPGQLGDIFRAELLAEEMQLQSEFEDYKAYPVISVGFNFNFF